MRGFAKSVTALCLAAAMLTPLCACGETERIVEPSSAPQTSDTPSTELKEFSAIDGSYTISMSVKWVQDEDSTAEMLSLSNVLGTELALVFQIPKNTVVAGSSMEMLRASTEETYGVESSDPVDGFEMPGLSDVCAYRGKVTASGLNYEGCFVYGQSDYAFYAIAFFAFNWKEEMMDDYRTYCATFSENAPEVENTTTVELTDTVRWINASYAILTEVNGWDYNMFAGAPANDANRELEQLSLSEWWGVTDRQSAEDTLGWILEEGHRAKFAEDMEYLESIGLGELDDRITFLAILTDADEEMAAKYAEWYEMYENYGPTAIDAWDYCRALNLLSFYYLAGYYTEQEALDGSLEIAKTLQSMYGSWDELVDSYLRGYEYWSEESSAERRGIYEDLKSRADDPYAVDYNTELTKTW